jgi:hypothetical protein
MPIYPDPLVVRELDGTPSAFVTELVFPNGTISIDDGVATFTGSATTDASLLVSGTLVDARLSANVPLLNALNTFTAKQTANAGINVANNQSIEFARTNGYVGWNSIGVGLDNILNVRSNNAILSMDPVSGVVASAVSFQVTTGGNQLRTVSGQLQVRNSANTFSGNFLANGIVAEQAVSALVDGSSVSYYASGAMRRTTGGVWFFDAPFADSQFVFRTGTGFTERLRLSNAGLLTATSLAESSVAASGTGGLVRLDSPTLVTPVLGRANATSLVLSEAFELGTRTIGTLPLASVSNGRRFQVSDDNNRVVFSNGTVWLYEGTEYQVGTLLPGTIVIKIDTATTGAKKLFLRVPYACTIVSWELVADISGDLVLDIWKDSYANYPPINADSITGSAKPTLTAAIKAQSSTLTGWTTSIAAGDYLEVEVESVSGPTVATLTLNTELV